MAIYGYWVHSGAPDEHQRTPPQGMSTATTRATRRAPGQRYICTDPTTQSQHRDAHEGRQTRRKGQKKRTEEGKNEGMKYYNKRSRAKLS